MTNRTRVTDIEQQLWTAADELRANSNLRAAEYSVPVLGLIFLRYADAKFSRVEAEIEQELAAMSDRRRSRVTVRELYQSKGVMYVPDAARFKTLLHLPEGANIGQNINEAMRAIEDANPQLKDVLPKSYNRLNNSSLVTLLKNFGQIHMDIAGDVFGQIYEYFLSQFAMTEGQRGGEFFTPPSIVRLIVEILEPFGGRILDPACGSGGMFVQSARFVEEHKNGGEGSPHTDTVGAWRALPPDDDNQPPLPLDQKQTISIYGQERVSQTTRLCRMNMAVHGLEGDIRQANSYYENPHNAVDKFDFVLANPPFNVNNVDKERIEGDPRYPFGIPRVDNGNYLWIQMFYAALNDTGRAGFVMANSASDARHSEQEIREQLIKSGAVDVMIAVGSNFFYTVTLPVTLWFLDKGKAHLSPDSHHPSPIRSADTTLFIDARPFFRQITRAVRDFTDEQLAFLADIVRLYRGEAVEVDGRDIPLDAGLGGVTAMAELFPAGKYRDVAGLCKVATMAEIEGQGWSLNPGRYVGVGEKNQAEIDFNETMENLRIEFLELNFKARELEEIITVNLENLMS